MRFALVALAVLAADAHRADACTCALNQAPISPADGATGVPTNAAIFYATTPTPLTQIALADAGGHAVSLTIAQHGTFLIGTPGAPLAAHTTYQLTAQTVAGPYQTTFTTGDGIDTTAPAFAGVTAISPQTIGFAPQNPAMICGTCGIVMQDGRVSRLHVDFADPPSDVVLLAVTVLDGTTTIGEVGMVRGWWAERELGYSACGGGAPALDPGTEYCVRITAYDAAGNTAGADAVACSVAAECAPAPDECTIPTTCDPMPMQPAPDPHGEPGGCTTGSVPGLVLVLGSITLLLRRRQ